MASCVPPSLPLSLSPPSQKLKVQAAGVSVLENGDSDGSDEFKDVPDEMEGSDEGEGEEDMVTASAEPMLVC